MYFTNNPSLALGATIVIEAIGAIPTLIKTYGEPKSEDGLAWGLFFAANAINLLAINNWTVVLAAYQVYSFSIVG